MTSTDPSVRKLYFLNIADDWPINRLNKGTKGTKLLVKGVNTAMIRRLCTNIVANHIQ